MEPSPLPSCWLTTQLQLVNINGRLSRLECEGAARLPRARNGHEELHDLVKRSTPGAFKAMPCANRVIEGWVIEVVVEQQCRKLEGQHLIPRKDSSKETITFTSNQCRVLCTGLVHG